MTMISALHNVSRSLGVALLAASDKMLVFYFTYGEIALYLMVKYVRGGFFVLGSGRENSEIHRYVLCTVRL